ncbi:hypothetical protein H9632_01445 [Solibacillus sp. Sa1YVA6]|uniref:Uncharacterized protein n=2 Tax=Solibacillus merdavium TaxID=2762218 RepID=A0ABR8XIE7_9BACL|nr:hypothetical protein [Solibacillus merdavium]
MWDLIYEVTYNKWRYSAFIIDKVLIWAKIMKDIPLIHGIGFLRLFFNQEEMAVYPYNGYYSVLTTRSLLIAEKMSTLEVYESMKENGGLSL